MFSGLVLAMASATGQEDTVFSGPQPGEPLTPFKVKIVLGDDAGKQVDPVEMTGNRVAVIVFVHERTRPTFGLTNVIMNMVASRDKEKVAGTIAWLSQDPTETENWMKRIPAYFPKDVLLGISPDGQEGPGAYGLNRNVAMTVLVGRQGKVVANFALVQPSIQADGPKVFKAIIDAMGETEVPDVAQFSGRRMTVRQPDNGDPDLRSLLSPVIKRDATDEEVEKAAKAVEDFAAKNEAARKQIGEIANRIINADRLSAYGTKKAQEYITKWAKHYGTKTPDRTP
jgi:hypothetical protein